MWEEKFLILFAVITNTITVIPDPVEEIKILTLPQKYTRKPGNNITLPCSTIHAGGTVVTWSKDGQVLSADNVKVLNDNRLHVEHQPKRGVNISIDNLNGEDSGLYKCSLNFNKKALHVEHRLQVEVPPSIHFIHPLKTIIVKKGSDVRLECQAGGHPTPVIHWARQHNQPFSREPGNSLTIKGDVLHLRNITRADSGQYICRAENGVGHGAVRESVVVDVMHPPVVNIEKTWIHVGEGETVSIKCQVIANPVPKVVWYKDTMKLIETSRLHILRVGDTYKLTITDLVQNDWGQYFCGASNKLGEVSKAVIITGAPGKPDISHILSFPHLYTLDLMWAVVSTYIPLTHQVTLWDAEKFIEEPQKNSIVRQIQSFNNSVSYSVSGLQPTTVYGVTVRCKNKWGWGPVSDISNFKTLAKGFIIFNTTTDDAAAELKYDDPDPLKVQPEVSSSSTFLPTITFVIYSMISKL